MKTKTQIKGLLGGEGNRKLQQRILNYLKGGGIHPGIILSGPDKEIKLTIAKGMAKFLLCQKKSSLASGEDPFCNSCSICQRIEKGIHPDVIVLGSEDEEQIKIDQVRQICHQMEVSPIEASSKVCIIDDCHRMNASSANAFLKTLEEPGTNRQFFLLTSQVGSLLPTIISRCLQFTFKPTRPDYELEAEWEEKFTAQLSKSLSSRNLSELLTMLKGKELCLKFIRFVQKSLRDLILKAVPQKSVFPFEISLPQALNQFEDSIKLEGQLRTNANYGLMVEGFMRKHFFSTEI